MERPGYEDFANLTQLRNRSQTVIIESRRSLRLHPYHITCIIIFNARHITNSWLKLTRAQVALLYYVNNTKKRKFVLHMVDRNFHIQRLVKNYSIRTLYHKMHDKLKHLDATNLVRLFRKKTIKTYKIINFT